MQRDELLISIVMPVKNAEPFLNECMDSIIAQTHQNWELIAVNDDSTDKSLSILKKYEEKDDRVSVLNNTGIGIISALQIAYARSKGAMVTRMDADDIMMPKKLELLSQNLLEKGRGNIAVGLVKYFTNGSLGEGFKKYEDWLNALTCSEENFSEIYKECVVPSPCWMMHREDFDKCRAFSSNVYPEDFDLCFRMYEHQFKIASCPEVLHLWRDHKSRSSRTLQEYSDNSFLELKTHYFLQLDYDRSQDLVIWGAGKKGKKVASILTDQEISFRWICNNPKKIGKTINGVLLESPSSLTQIQKTQVLILVANPDEQKDIQSHKIFEIPSTESYYFC